MIEATSSAIIASLSATGRAKPLGVNYVTQVNYWNVTLFSAIGAAAGVHIPAIFRFIGKELYEGRKEHKRKREQEKHQLAREMDKLLHEYSKYRGINDNSDKMLEIINNYRLVLSDVRSIDIDHDAGDALEKFIDQWTKLVGLEMEYKAWSAAMEGRGHEARATKKEEKIEDQKKRVADLEKEIRDIAQKWHTHSRFLGIFDLI